MEQQSAAQLIRSWGSLHRSAHNLSSTSIDWAAVKLMLQAALKDADAFESRLRELVKTSNELLSPLGDPLLTDLGLHRWLRMEREEAYSDWLKWVLDQIKDGERVLKLLQIQDRAALEFCRGKTLTIHREVIIDAGRLDLILTHGSEFLMVVEVKTTAAEKAEVEKQLGYCDWISRQAAAQQVPPVMLVVAAQEQDYCGFVPVLWEDLCIGLRRLAPKLYESIGISKAAMILAFVGAVETNLLGLSVPEGPSNPHRLTFGRTIHHLERSLDRGHNG
jgi:hypothetical protein